MSFCHDWILTRYYDDEPETSFTPNGTLVNGIPIGTIRTTYRRVVEGAKVGPESGPFAGGGGTSIDAETGALTIGVAGGTTKTISKLSGGTTPDSNAFVLTERIDNIADMILGLYTFSGKWVSTLTTEVVGGWSGGGA